MFDGPFFKTAIAKSFNFQENKIQRYILQGSLNGTLQQFFGLMKTNIENVFP